VEIPPGSGGVGCLQSLAMDRSRLSEAVALIKGRRTNLRIDADSPIDRALITELCEAAVWAPNHKLTEPWRFAALTGAARTALGEAAAAALAGSADTARIEKTRAKYRRAPAIVVVGCAPDQDPMRHREDRDAVAAGVQNLLLAATAAGLASHWATGAAAQLTETAALCGFEPGTEIVGLIYLGWPVGAADDPGRRPPNITWLDENTD